MPYQISSSGYGGTDNLAALLGSDYQKYKTTNPYGLTEYAPEGYGNVSIGGQQYNVRYDNSTGKYMMSSLADPHLGAYVYGEDGKLENWTPYNPGNGWGNFATALGAAFTMGSGLFDPGISAGASSAGPGSAGWGTDLGTSTGGLSEAATGGTGAMGAGQAAPYTFNAAADSQLANAGINAAGGDALAGYSAAGVSPAVAGGASPWYQPIADAAKSAFTTPGGQMDYGSLIKAGGSLLGGALQNNSNQSAASDSAAAQQQAAQAAADAAKFRPVGITSRFGQSGFQFDANGNLTGAGYQLDPLMKEFQGASLAQAQNYGLPTINQTHDAGQSLFNLGNQYLATSPDQAAANWMQSQQNLLAPSRERQLAGVRNGLFNSGRTGLAVGATGARPDGSAGLGAANPEMEAYYNAIAQQDAGLATQAQQQGRDATAFGAGLFSTGTDIMNNGYKPFQTALGNAGTIEGMGQDTLNMGAQLGGRTAQAGSQAGQFLFAGGTGAARTQQAAASQNPWASAITGFASSPQAQAGINSFINSVWK